jgi:hypothetical protein
VHLLADSTGLRLFGPGGWLEDKHGSKRRWAWRMLHLATDADTGHIVASVLTSRDTDDSSQVGPLLDWVAGSVASITGDGDYDQDDVYAGIAARHQMPTSPSFRLLDGRRPPVIGLPQSGPSLPGGRHLDERSGPSRSLCCRQD